MRPCMEYLVVLIIGLIPFLICCTSILASMTSESDSYILAYHEHHANDPI